LNGSDDDENNDDCDHIKEDGANSRPLSFVVIIPVCELKGYELLIASPFLRHHEIIQKQEHNFCDGSQQASKNRHRHANSDTAILFLQTDAGNNKWPITKESISDLKLSFIKSMKLKEYEDKEFEKTKNNNNHNNNNNITLDIQHHKSKDDGIKIPEDILRFKKSRKEYESYEQNKKNNQQNNKHNNKQNNKQNIKTNQNQNKRKVKTRIGRKKNKN